MSVSLYSRSRRRSPLLGGRHRALAVQIALAGMFCLLVARSCSGRHRWCAFNAIGSAVVRYVTGLNSRSLSRALLVPAFPCSARWYSCPP